MNSDTVDGHAMEQNHNTKNADLKTHKAQQLAVDCAQAMWQNDKASQNLGMQIKSIAPGQASLTMVVTETMTNGLKTCHGGYLFTLADSTFAFACNSYNQYTVAQHCAISFLAPAYEEDILIATAVEQTRRGRSGIYDVTIVNQNNEVVAEFRGNSRTVKGQHIGEEPAA